MTRLKTKLYLLVALAVAGAAVMASVDGLPSYRPAPRSHTPPHTWAIDKHRDRVVRMRADWQSGWPPVRVVYQISNSVPVVLAGDHIAGSPFWQIEMAYDPSQTYMVEVFQANKGTASCMIKVIDPASFGFEDNDVVHGPGAAHCWVNRAA